MLQLSPAFYDALIYAARLHAGQTRKATGVPYVSHLMAVTSLVLDYGGNEEEAIAALLHDGPEDQGGRATLEAIRLLFGDRVAEIVDGCTDTYDHPKPLWRPRKEKYLAHLEVASLSVCLVSAADKVHNVRSILQNLADGHPDTFTKFNGGPKGTFWYYRSVLEVLTRRLPNPIVAELARAVEEMDRRALAAGLAG
jgi:(p)ppGpp synthase/HD superfamily hydrolase